LYICIFVILVMRLYVAKQIQLLEAAMPGFEDAPREVTRQVNQPQSGAIMLKKTHPAVIVAAGAVTIFCAVGIGVMTGIIPNARALNGNQPVSATTATGLPPTLASAGASQASIGSMVEAPDATAATPAPAPALKPIDKPTMGQPLARNEPARSTASTTPAKKPVAPVANTASPAPVPVPTYNTPSSANERPTVVAANTANTSSSPLVCSNCGTVESVSPVSQQGQGSGAGAVIGGVIGGVLGHQVGGGRGKDVATVAGAVGGAVLGNQIEKANKTTQSVNIRVKLEDGTYQTIKSETDQGFRSGDRVKIENGRLIRN
jgi:outer membrane lipoprotein SlyB